jgi:hypothetical protein
MPAADRTRRSPLACLLVVLALALGLSGAAGTGTDAGGGHAAVTSAVTGSGPQAVLGQHLLPRPGAPRPDTAALAASALLALLPPARWRRRRPVHAGDGVPGRPPRGGRAPPASPRI